MLRLVRGISAAFIPLALLAVALALAAEPLFVAEAVVVEPEAEAGEVLSSGPERLTPDAALLAATAVRVEATPERLARCLRLTRYGGAVRIVCRDNSARLVAPGANAAAEAYVAAAHAAREAARVEAEAWQRKRIAELQAAALAAEAAAAQQRRQAGARDEAARERQRQLDREAAEARELLDAFVQRAGHAVFEPSGVQLVQAAAAPAGVNNAEFLGLIAQLTAGALALSAAGVLLTRRPRATGSGP